jgi:glycosyltransferase involved in cell wall biosynthesis
MASAIVSFLEHRPGPHVIHAFATWVDSAAAASRALAKSGVDAITIGSCWDCIGNENGAKRRSPVIQTSPRLWLKHALEFQVVLRTAVSAERNGFRACRTVLVNYDAIRRLLHRSYGEQIEVRKIAYAAPSAFEPDLTTCALPSSIARLADPDSPLIVCVSRHEGRKGIDLLIHALARLHQAGARFRACLVGGGILLEKHQALVTSFGLSDRVALPGRVPDVREYLHHADIFVLPSTAEGSGSVSVLEALQAGAAVVATAIDGIPEDLTDGCTGLLVQPDAVDLARGIERLLGDSVLRATLARAGRALYEARFSPGRLVTDLSTVYAELGLQAAV